MATVTYVRTIKFVAEVLEEDPELLQAIVSNDDNLSYGNIITVYTGDDESVTALTDDGMEELEQMLSHARRSPDEWSDFKQQRIEAMSSNGSVRDAQLLDVGKIVALGALLHAESNFKHASYSIEKTTKFVEFSILSEYHLVIVVEEDAVVVGYLIAFVGPHFFSDELVAFDMSFFIHPDSRNFRYASRCVRNYRDWAAARGAKGVMLSQATGSDMERVKLLYQRLD